MTSIKFCQLALALAQMMSTYLIHYPWGQNGGGGLKFGYLCLHGITKKMCGGLQLYLLRWKYAVKDNDKKNIDV